VKNSFFCQTIWIDKSIRKKNERDRRTWMKSIGGNMKDKMDDPSWLYEKNCFISVFFRFLFLIEILCWKQKFSGIQHDSLFLLSIR